MAWTRMTTRNILAGALTVLMSSIGAAQAPKPAAPAVTKADVQILQHARALLSAPEKWDRDEQECLPSAPRFSLFCALYLAAKEVTGTFDNGSAALQATRRAIDETPNYRSYNSRLADYNRDTTVSFEDLQKLLQLVEQRLASRLDTATP
jgi:hypothetical protein